MHGGCLVATYCMHARLWASPYKASSQVMFEHQACHPTVMISIKVNTPEYQSKLGVDVSMIYIAWQFVVHTKLVLKFIYPPFTEGRLSSGLHKLMPLNSYCSRTIWQSFKGGKCCLCNFCTNARLLKKKKTLTWLSNILLSIRPGKLDLLFRISHLLDLRVGGHYSCISH